MRFYIDRKKNNEWLLHYDTGVVFFIVKEQYGNYYTSQLDEYKPIKDEIKDWFINELNKGLEDSYDFSKITQIIRDHKLKKLLNNSEMDK